MEQFRGRRLSGILSKENNSLRWNGKQGNREKKDRVVFIHIFLKILMLRKWETNT